MDAMSKELGPNLFCIKCDVTVEEQVKNAVEATVAKFGAIHVALTCAGVAWPVQTLTSKKTLDTKVFEKVVAINLFGSTYVAKYAAVAMAKNTPNEMGERGVILFVSSVAGEEG